jgi:cytochrome c peroxidase
MTTPLTQTLKSKPGLLAIGAGLIALIAASMVLFNKTSTLNPNNSPTLLGAPAQVSFAFTQSLPTSTGLNLKKVALGQQLFHDVRLSKDDTIGCVSCHGLHSGGVDNRFRSVGVDGGIGGVNAPSVFNSGLNFVQFWDGRAPSLEAQIEGPVQHPLEMGSTWDMVVSKLGRDANYPQAFKDLYADGITPTNIKDAIATFERSLITPNSRFDKFLGGDQSALNAQEKHGYELFQSYGCASCHQGMNLGGNMYEKMGLMGDYFADRGNITEADRGRFNLTKDPQNMHEFRVPSLRNVALTAPYFHDGHAQTLEAAIAIMAKYQLGRPMPATDLDAIAAFLRSLTGQYNGKQL